MENMKSTAGASRDAEEADAICNKNICLPWNTREREQICTVTFLLHIIVMYTSPVPFLNCNSQLWNIHSVLNQTKGKTLHCKHTHVQANKLPGWSDATLLVRVLHRNERKGTTHRDLEMEPTKQGSVALASPVLLSLYQWSRSHASTERTRSFQSSPARKGKALLVHMVNCAI